MSANMTNFQSSFWFPGGRGPCWVCGVETETALDDYGWQHMDCDAYPAPEGEAQVVRGLVEFSNAVKPHA